MTKEEVIDLANQMALFGSIWINDDGNVINDLVQFANLVADFERRACLKICEEQANTNYWEGADVCAETIKERWDKK